MLPEKHSRWRLVFADGSSEEIEADRVTRVRGSPGQVAVYEWEVDHEHRSHERLVCTLEGIARLERLTRPGQL
jgi:hypothetical protein